MPLKAITKRGASLRDEQGRFENAKKEALALADKVLSDGGKKKRTKYGKRPRKRGMGDVFTLQGLKDRASSMRDNFGENIARNVGEVLNPIAARDVGYAMLGGVMYLLIPPALNIATRRNFDHNGAGGVAVGLGGAMLVGLLTGNVPFIAGALSAFAAQAMYVLFDKQVLEPATGIRLARWDVKSDATMADGGIYDNQPVPHEVLINGQPAVVYGYDDMIKQLENGATLKAMAKNDESVNHLADGASTDVLQDSVGQHWLQIGDGRSLLSDENGEVLMMPDKTFMMREGDAVFPVDAELQPVPPAPQLPPYSAHSSAHSPAYSPAQSMNDQQTQRPVQRPKFVSRTGHTARKRF